MVLGVKLIDEQHHHLVELINGFGRAMLDGRGGKDLMQLFGDLANYVHVHFSSEEVLMDKNDYPDAETHRMLHREFTGQLAEFILEFQEGNKMLSPEVHRYLRDWLVDHIQDHTQNADRKLAAFLREKGTR